MRLEGIHWACFLIETDGLVAVKRDDETPLTRLKLRPIKPSNIGGKYYLTFPSNLKIWQNENRTGAVTTETEFNTAVETTVFVEAMGKSSTLNDQQVVLNYSMKIRLFPILYGLLALIINVKNCNAAVDLKSEIAEIIDHAAQMLIQDPTGVASQEYIAQKRLVSSVIPKYLYEVPGTRLEHSYQRQSRVEEVEKILASHEQILVDVTLATLKSKSGDTSTIRLFVFSPASPLIKNTLEQVINATKGNQSTVEQAYDTYFMLQLDDEPFRKSFVDFIKTNLNQRTSLGHLADGLYTMSGRWAVPEMEELYLQAIQTPISPENYIGGNNRLSLIAKIDNAARGLDYYGVMATNYIEALKARIKELDLTSGDERNTLVQLEQTLAIMEGRRMPEIAVSWKGQLLGISKETYRKWFGHDRVIQDAAVFDQSSSNNKLMTNQPTNVVVTSLPIQPTTNKIIPETENSNWLRWVLIVIGLGIVGFLVFNLFGKKDSNREK